MDGAEITISFDERTALMEVVKALTPDVKTLTWKIYSDRKMEEEFQRYVGPEIEHNRATDLQTLFEELNTDGDKVVLTQVQAFAWLRGLNLLRLVAAKRLGIKDDSWEDAVSPETRKRREYAMLVTLGALQEHLISTLEN
jgi:hypothetical protein